MIPETRGCLLEKVIYLCEYETCDKIPLEAVRGDILNAREVRTFKINGSVYLGTLHYVGVVPFSCRQNPQCPGHVLISLPKGTAGRSGEDPDVDRSLFRFFDLLALCSKVDRPPVNKETVPGFEGIPRAGERFVLLFAVYYAALLRDLCLRDFRRFYRQEEAPLQGRIRGRVHIAGHLRNEVRGQAHLIPCRWEEFTPDNWDNRALAKATRVLQSAPLDRAGGGTIRGLFRSTAPYFESIDEEVPVFSSDFHRTRLGRVSTRYRSALTWASFIIRGVAQPSAAGNAPKLTLDANEVFELLARSVAKSAAPEVGWKVRDNVRFDGLLGEQGPDAKPDIVVIDATGGVVGVGDAKYKLVMECLDDKVGTDFDQIAKVRLKASDLYQLYSYMRLTRASRGFFVVPFWESQGQPARLREAPRFQPSPLDSLAGGDNHALAVLGLNMMKPAAAAREGQRELARWLSRHRSL